MLFSEPLLKAFKKAQIRTVEELLRKHETMILADPQGHYSRPGFAFGPDFDEEAINEISAMLRRYGMLDPAAGYEQHSVNRLVVED
jgi:hypothetical protein